MTDVTRCERMGALYNNVLHRSKGGQEQSGTSCFPITCQGLRGHYASRRRRYHRRELPARVRSVLVAHRLWVASGENHTQQCLSFSCKRRLVRLGYGKLVQRFLHALLHQHDSQGKQRNCSGILSGSSKPYKHWNPTAAPSK